MPEVQEQARLVLGHLIKRVTVLRGDLEDRSGRAFYSRYFPTPTSQKLSAVKGINRRAFESENPKGNQD
jgi:hypothetical protein